MPFAGATRPKVIKGPELPCTNESILAAIQELQRDVARLTHLVEEATADLTEPYSDEEDDELSDEEDDDMEDDDRETRSLAPSSTKYAPRYQK